MTDNQLIAALISTLTPAIQSNYDNTYVIIQKNQPTQQGAPSTPTVYLEKLFDKRYGFTSESLNLLADKTQFPDIPQVFTQVVMSTVQFSAFVIQDPSNIALPTASDVANYVAMLLSVDGILNSLRAQGIKVLRIMEVLNPYWGDDQDRYEANPSFNVVLQHQRDFSTAVPDVDATEVDIYPV